MKLSVFISIFLLFIIVSSNSFSQEDTLQYSHKEWILKKSKDNISSYVRWITLNSGISVRQRKVEMVIRSTLSSVVATIKDDAATRQWLSRTMQCYNFNKTDNFRWSNYTRFDIPWPLKNQDLVTNNYLTQDLKTKNIHIEIRGDSILIPPNDNVERIRNFNGSWDIIQQDSNTIRVVYKLFTGEKPWLPFWLIDPIIESGLVDSFIKMQKIIADKNREETRLSYISE